MKPKIIKDLDVYFTENELEEQVKLKLSKDVLLAAEEYRVIKPSEYKSKSSIQFQIAEKYGEGTHYLIPNLAGIGIGKQKATKKRKPLRYCTEKEYNERGLSINDISYRKLMECLKPFLKYEVKKEKEKQQTL